jgi:hypothetical protein
MMIEYTFWTSLILILFTQLSKYLLICIKLKPKLYKYQRVEVMFSTKQYYPLLMNSIMDLDITVLDFSKK